MNSRSVPDASINSRFHSRDRAHHSRDQSPDASINSRFHSRTAHITPVLTGLMGEGAFRRHR